MNDSMQLKKLLLCSVLICLFQFPVQAVDCQASNKIIFNSKKVANGRFKDIRSNADGDLIVAALGNTIKVGNIDHLDQKKSLFAHDVKEKDITSLCVLPQEHNMFLSAGKGENVVKLWDARSKTCAQRLSGPTRHVDNLMALPERHLLAESYPVYDEFAREFMMWDLRKKVPQVKKVEEQRDESSIDYVRFYTGDTNNKVVLIGECDNNSFYYIINLTSIKDFEDLIASFPVNHTNDSYYKREPFFIHDSSGAYIGAWKHPHGDSLKVGRRKQQKFLQKLSIPFYKPRCFIDKKGLVFIEPSIPLMPRDSVTLFYTQHMRIWDKAIKENANDELHVLDISKIINSLQAEGGSDINTFCGLKDDFKKLKDTCYHGDAQCFQNALASIEQRRLNGKRKAFKKALQLIAEQSKNVKRRKIDKS